MTRTRLSLRSRLTFHESALVQMSSSSPSTAAQTGVATDVPFFRYVVRLTYSLRANS